MFSAIAAISAISSQAPEEGDVYTVKPKILVLLSSTILSSAALAAELPTPESGKTIVVPAGTYNENLTISGDNITYKCAAQFACKIKAPGGEHAVKLRGNGITFQGFEVDGSGSDVRTGIDTNGDSNRVVGNYVHDINTTGNAIGSAIGIGDSTNSSIDGNKIERVGNSEFDHGIYWYSGDAEIRNNNVSGASGFGIHLWHTPEDGRIAGNTAYNNGICGITVGAGEHDGSLAQGIVVENNTTYGNHECGIQEAGNVADNVFRNNKVAEKNGMSLKSGSESGTNGAESGSSGAPTVVAIPNVPEAPPRRPRLPARPGASKR